MADSVKIFQSFYEATKDESPEDFKASWCALFEHAFNGADDTGLTGAAKMFYTLTAPIIDKSAGISEARAAAGKTGGEAKPSKRKQTASKKKQTEANAKQMQADIGYRSMDIGDMDLGDRKEDIGDIPPKSPHGGKTQVGMVDESELSEPVKESVKEWLKYKHERKFSYKATSLQKLIKKVGEMESLYGSEWVIKAIDNSIANGWQGISWEAMNRVRGQPSAYMQAIHDRVDIVDTWK